MVTELVPSEKSLLTIAIATILVTMKRTVFREVDSAVPPKIASTTEPAKAEVTLVIFDLGVRAVS